MEMIDPTITMLPGAGFSAATFPAGKLLVDCERSLTASPTSARTLPALGAVCPTTLGTVTVCWALTVDGVTVTATGAGTGRDGLIVETLAW